MVNGKKMVRWNDEIDMSNPTGKQDHETLKNLCAHSDEETIGQKLRLSRQETARDIKRNNTSTDKTNKYTNNVLAVQPLKATVRLIYQNNHNPIGN